MSVSSTETEVTHQSKVDTLSGYLNEIGVKPIKVEDTPLYTRFILKEPDPNKVVLFRGINGNQPREYFDQFPYGGRLRDSEGKIHTEPSLLAASNLLAREPTPRNLIQWFKVRKEVEPDIRETEHLLNSMLMVFETPLIKGKEGEVPNLERIMRFDQGRIMGSNPDTWYTPYVSATLSPKEALGYSRYRAMLVLSMDASKVLPTSSDEVSIKGGIDKGDICEIVVVKPKYSERTEEEVEDLTKPFKDRKGARVEGTKQDIQYTKEDFDSINPFLEREYSEIYAKKIATRYPKLMSDPSFKLEKLSGDPYTDMVYSIYKHYREKDGRPLTDEDIEEYKVAIPRRKYRNRESYVGNLPGMEEYK